MIYDQFSDKSFRVLNNKLQEFPSETRELIKTAQIDYEVAESLPEHSFAWKEMRKFAIHTPEHAVLSAIYAHGQELPEHVQASIKKACDIYGIEVAPTPVEKTAEVVENIEDYLIPHMKFGKISDEETVKEASRFFTHNSKKMNMETRVNAAVTLVKKASQYKAKLPTRIFKYAGMTESNRKVTAEWLEARCEATKEEPMKIAYTKLAGYVEDSKNKIESRGDLLKLADAIYNLDKKANLMARYDISLPDPVLTVFNTNKLAEEKLTLAGKSISIQKLLGIPKETYADLLGEDVIPEITDSSGNLDREQLESILKTLPADMQMMMVKNLGL